MDNTHSRPQQFWSLLSLALLLPFIISIRVVAAGPFATASCQTTPTPLCGADTAVAHKGLSSGINKPREKAHGEPGPYEYPPQVPLDIEEYPVAPAGLELEQVHVFVRHGERTPTSIQLANAAANIPAHWNMCKRFRAAAAEATDIPTTVKAWYASLGTRKLVEQRNGTVAEDECLLGELTDKGRQSTFNFGLALRELYLGKLGFIPDVLENVRNVYFRSTNVERTMESLQYVMHGLYPNEKCAGDAYPSLLVRNANDESLPGNPSVCKRLSILLTDFAKAAAVTYNPKLQPLDEKLSKYIDGAPVRLDGRPRASDIMDTIFAARAHGVEVPPEFEDKDVMDLIEQAVVYERFGDKTKKVQQLAIGELLGDLTNKMQQKVDKGNKDPLKLLVHATHGTLIGGLCSTLDAFDEKWPAFTASVTFELFKQDTKPESQQQGQVQSVLARLNTDATSVGYYVRMRYQNENKALPLCKEGGKHLDGAPEFCTFKAFRDWAVELVPKNWDAECV